MTAILPNVNSINCLFEDDWYIDTFPLEHLGLTFIHNNPGVDQISDSSWWSFYK